MNARSPSCRGQLCAELADVLAQCRVRQEHRPVEVDASADPDGRQPSPSPRSRRLASDRTFRPSFRSSALFSPLGKGAVLGIGICAGGEAREFVQHEPGVRDPDGVDNTTGSGEQSRSVRRGTHFRGLVSVVHRDHDVTAAGQITDRDPCRALARLRVRAGRARPDSYEGKATGAPCLARVIGSRTPGSRIVLGRSARGGRASRYSEASRPDG